MILKFFTELKKVISFSEIETLYFFELVGGFENANKSYNKLPIHIILKVKNFLDIKDKKILKNIKFLIIEFQSTYSKIADDLNKPILIVEISNNNCLWLRLKNNNNFKQLHEIISINNFKRNMLKILKNLRYD